MDNNIRQKIVETVMASQQPSFWETDIKMEDAKEDTPPVIVFLSATVRDKLAILMAKFHRMEWLAYLLGERGDNGNFVINDIILPKQQVSPSFVSVEEGVNVKTVGVIHSHHDMGNFFSGTDDEYINQNHDLSLCITNKGITGQARVKTDDNNYLVVPIEIGITKPTFQPFLDEIDAMVSIRKPQIIPVHHAPPFGSPFFDKPDYKTSAKKNIVGAIVDYKAILMDEEDPIIGQPEMYTELIDMSNLLDSINDDEKFGALCTLFIENEDAYTFEAISLVEEIDVYEGEILPYEKKALVRLKNHINEIIDKMGN